MMTAAKKGSIECLLRLRKGAQWGKIHSDIAFLLLKSYISSNIFLILELDSQIWWKSVSYEVI